LRQHKKERKILCIFLVANATFKYKTGKELIGGNMISGRGKDIIIDYKGKNVIGLTERIILKSPGTSKSREILARIDTGATKSSIDVKLAAELNVGPVLKAKLVKSASGTSVRPMVECRLEIANKNLSSEFTIADRSHMKYRVLIGQNILCNNSFLIDPSKGAKGEE
jgi:hypothetical protein